MLVTEIVVGLLIATRFNSTSNATFNASVSHIEKKCGKYEICKEWIFSNSVSSRGSSRGIFICVCVPKNTRADEKVWKGAPIISALRLAFNNIQGCKHIINTVMRGVGFRGRRRGGSERIRVDGQEGTGPREGKEIVWGYCTSPLAAVTESLEPQRGRMASNPMTRYQAAEAHGTLLNEGVTLYTHTHTHNILAWILSSNASSGHTAKSHYSTAKL